MIRFVRVLAVAVIAGFAVLGLRVLDASSVRAAPAGGAVAIFAGGCFWSMESAFDKVPGVLSTTSGFTGGKEVNPTYDDVSYGTTGHAESVQVTYDPQMVSYEQLLYAYWRNIDPLTKNGQFCDFAPHYRTAIFYLNDEQKRLAVASKDALTKSGRFKQPIVTEIVAAGPFYAAEAYHQNYWRTNAARYNTYRVNCGRDARLDELWGKEARGGAH